jgi:hypothetical protein
MSSLNSVWNQVEDLLSQGLSLIPVRDKQVGDKPPKTPYTGWKKYQAQQIAASELWDQAEKFDTTAVAIICGKISGNLECIDIDVKNWPGIDALIFKTIADLYPNLWSKLRIHKSPSGGYHILYKSIGRDVPGNMKLAKKSGQKGAALETRGEGGYVLAPPSMGYAVFKNNPIPIITWDERTAIIGICESFNEEIKLPPKDASRSKSDYYDENPFEHFNATCEPLDALPEWVFMKQVGAFMWFGRPGGRPNDVHGTFNTQTRLFYFFSTSLIFVDRKWMTPSTVLAEIQFQADKKLLYQWLVSKGYGKVKSSIEKKKIKLAAAQGGNIPDNFSIQAKQEYTQLLSQKSEKYPHGIFWSFDEEDKCSISREALYNVCEALGFRHHEGRVVKIVDKFIHEVNEREFFDEVKKYIQEEDAAIYEDICNAYESFVQRSGKFTSERIRLLETGNIVTDDADTCLKFYENGYLTITANEFSWYEWSDLPGLMWHARIQPRVFTGLRTPKGKYVEFLNLAISPEIAEHVLKVVGFLSHEYKDETTAYIIVLTEECPDPKLGGGSGKNVFCNLLRNTTTYVSKPGSQTKFDEKFYQAWNGERIFGISDVPKNFDFVFLKELSSGDGIIKKLWQNERTVRSSDMPKLVVQTNFSYEITDGGLKRRIIPIEFTDFFTKCGGVDIHFNCYFPVGWTDEDWNGFDNYIARSVQAWLKAGKKLSPVSLTETGWKKQFEHTYGVVAAEFIYANINRWVDISFISNEQFKNELDFYYNENSIHPHYRPSSSKINKAIADFCEHQKLIFVRESSKRSDLGIILKGREFAPKAPF